jgi:hypothetical protein
MPIEINNAVARAAPAAAKARGQGGSSGVTASDRSPAHNRAVVLAAFIALGILSTLVVSTASWLEGSDAWVHPLRWLGTLDQGAALSLLSQSAQVVAGVLAILITVVAIVLQISAARYTHRVTALFVHDPLNIAVMVFFVLTTVLCIALATVLSGKLGVAPVIPHGGFLLAVAMLTTAMVALLPYFVYVFHFVSPLGVIARIRADALKKVLKSGNDSLSLKRAVIAAVEEIEDVARGAMKNNDRGIAMAAAESLGTLLADVTAMRERLPASWCQVDDAVACDPDFVTMSQTVLEEISRNQSWFEAKIMRQYLNLFGEAVGVARDVASMIAIHTRELAERFSARPAFLEMCQRAFHSYLRAAINGHDQRTAYFVLHQYRLLGEALLGQNNVPTVLEVARRIGFYGKLAKNNGQPFLLEVAAYDLSQLVEAAAANPVTRNALLDAVLALEDGRDGHLPGVRRVQMQLATFFLLRGEAAPARRIAEELASEIPAVLDSARREIDRETSPSYWEINDRGANFSYLPPEQRARLDELFQVIDSLRCESVAVPPASGAAPAGGC